jgi:hypothetical protein
MSQCLVTAIPEAVVQRVLVDWLGIMSVVRLDSAFCNKTFRSRFLCIAYTDNGIYSVGVIDPQTERFLHWCLLRGTRVDNIILDNAPTSEAAVLGNFLSHQGAHLRSITIKERRREARYVLLEISVRCPLVESMFITCYTTSTSPWDEQFLLFSEKCRKVRILFLSRVTVSANSLENALRNCSNLTHLTINSMTCSLPKGMVFTSLEYLDFCDCSGVSDTTLLTISESCPKLQTLHVFRQGQPTRPITDVGVYAVLERCPLLRDTDVECAEGISQNLRMELVRRNNLTRIFVSSATWKGLDNSALQEILRLSGRLTALHCMFCEWLQDDTLLVCAQHCPLLAILSLTGCEAITTAGVVSLITGCGATLKSVALTGCVLLGDEVVMAIAEHCPLLEGIPCPAGVTDAAVVKLAEGCPLLVEICLNHANISDHSVVTLATHCPRLENVGFGPRSDITMDAVRALAGHCPNLSYLQLPYSLRSHALAELRLGVQVECSYQYGGVADGDYNSESNTTSDYVHEPRPRSCWSSFCKVISYTKVS